MPLVAHDLHCMKSDVYPLYAFSLPWSPLYLPCIFLDTLLYFLYAFIWPQSLLYPPFICISALFYTLYAFSWLCCPLNLPFLCIKALVWPPYVIDRPRSLFSIPFLFYTHLNTERILPFDCLRGSPYIGIRSGQRTNTINNTLTQ